MRLITVRVPEGEGAAVVKLALNSGIPQASTYQAQLYRAQQSPTLQDVVELEAATPLAKHFIEKLMLAPFFDPTRVTFSMRHPRSLVAQENPARETRPFVMPTLEVFEELWQFSHITWSLAARVLLAALLLVYGMIKMNLLVMIAGLLFLPYHHHMIAVALGVWTRQWRLAIQALLALLVTTTLIVVAGVVVALLTQPPMQFEEFGTLLTGFAIALIIGVAAAVATTDDAGRRELIGLAATAHITILPAWFGVSLIFGFPEAHVTRERLIGFVLSVSTLILAALLTFALLKMRGDVLKPLAKLGTSQE